MPVSIQTHGMKNRVSGQLITKAKRALVLYYNERKKALIYLMFLKQKRDGSIKATGSADGRS